MLNRAWGANSGLWCFVAAIGEAGLAYGEMRNTKVLFVNAITSYISQYPK